MDLSVGAAFNNCDVIADDNDLFDIQCAVYDKRTFVRRNCGRELSMEDDPFVDNDVGEYLSQGLSQPMYFVDGLPNVASNDRAPPEALYTLLNSNLEQFNETTVYTESVEFAASSRLTGRAETSPDIFIHEYSINLCNSPDLFESTSPQILDRNTSPDMFNDTLGNDENTHIGKHTIADNMQLVATPDISIHELNPIHFGVLDHRANNKSTAMNLIIENRIGHMPNLSVNDLRSIIENAPFNGNGTHSTDSSFFIFRDEPTEQDSEPMDIIQPRGTSQYSQAHSPDIFDNQNDEMAANFNEINIPNQNSVIQSQTLSPDIFEADDNDEDLVADSNETELTVNDLGHVGQSLTDEPNNDAVPQQISQAMPSVVRPMETNYTSRSEANEEYAARAYQNILLNQALVDNTVEMVVATNERENHQIDMDETHLTVASVQNERTEQLDERTKLVLNSIKNLLNTFEMAANRNEKVQLTVPLRHSWNNCEFRDGIFQLKTNPNIQMKSIRSASRLAIMRYLLLELAKQIELKRCCTFRELYYRDPELTGKQINVNDAVHDICCSLQACPWELGVFASAKGLLSGLLCITLYDDCVINCDGNMEGILLPHFTSRIKDIATEANFILVVEKDTVFRKLLHNNIVHRLGGKCILITGKGYPDTNTRIFLKKIWLKYQMPIYVLTDADPYGIEIMLTYRHGSLQLAYCNEHLAVPAIKWIGIFPSDITRFGIQTIPFRFQDNFKLRTLIDRPFITNQVYQELMTLKRMQRKSEIEGMADASCAYLIDVYLKHKLENEINI